MKMYVAVFAAVMGLGMALAGNPPLQLSLTPDVALVDRTERVEGVALSVWGENPQAALALGFVNGSTGASAGLSASLLLNYADDYKGVQWGLVNYTRYDFLGWQGGGVNYTQGSLKGLQTGLVNYAGSLTGVQLGFVNFASSTDTGVQIGLVNLMPASEWLSDFPDELAPAMILINWSL